MLLTANAKGVKKAQESKKAKKKIRTIAGRLMGELRRELSAEQLKKHWENLEIFEKVLQQKPGDRDKIYALHAPEVSCIAKGKAGKKYEFGSKVAVVVTQKSNLMMAAVSFRGKRE